MKKILVLALAAVMAMSALLAGCGSRQAEKKELQGLAVGVMPDIDSVPIIIAQEKGYFAEEGLKVDIQKFKSAMDRDAALQSGNLDGAVSDLRRRQRQMCIRDRQLQTDCRQGGTGCGTSGSGRQRCSRVQKYHHRVCD